jgi:hypothetical protein
MVPPVHSPFDESAEQACCATQALVVTSQCAAASEMAAQVASLLPAATHVFGVAVEHTSVEAELPPLVPSQSASVAHATQAVPTYFGLAVSMAAQEPSSLPMLWHTLFGFVPAPVEHTSVPVQPLLPTHATKIPTVEASAPALQTWFTFATKPLAEAVLSSELGHAQASPRTSFKTHRVYTVLLMQ